MTASGYKTGKNDAVRRRLVEALAGRCGDRGPALRDAVLEADDDDLDALICALVAREVREGRTERPTAEQLDVARREGWIHLPSRDLAKVVSR